MCNSKCYDVISIVVSLILGIVFAILVFFFPAFYPLGFLFGFLLSLAALLLMTITASSLLRQEMCIRDSPPALQPQCRSCRPPGRARCAAET